MRYQQPQTLDNWMAPDLELGSEAWWQEIGRRGCPLMQRTEEQSGWLTCVWLWRNKSVDTDIAAVYLWINAVTDTKSLQPDQMQHLSGTDIWFWQAELPSDWRGSYQLMPVGPSCLPVWQPDADIEYQQRQWWQKLKKQAVADPLNHNPAYAGKDQRLQSWASCPDAWPQIGFDDRSNVAYSPSESMNSELSNPELVSVRTRARSSSFRWQSQLLENSRRIWIHDFAVPDEKSTAQTNCPLVLILDGECWSQRLPILPALELATASGQIQASTYVFIDSIDTQHRSLELPCNPQFWQAIWDELLPAVAQNLQRQIMSQPVWLAGQSYGGLAAVYAWWQWPERVSGVICQSGSFWWPKGALLYQVDDPYAGRLTAELAQSSPLLREMRNSGQSDDAQYSVTSQPQASAAEDRSRISVRADKTLTKAKGEADGMNKIEFAKVQFIARCAKTPVFIEVGRQEGAMVSLNKSVADFFHSQNHQVRYREFQGGHDRICWRGGLIDGLAWLSQQKTAFVCAENCTDPSANRQK